MPQFYFSHSNSGHRTAELEAMILPDAEAAWYHAVRSAREIISQELRAGCLKPGQWVEIADEEGLPVSAVPLEEVAAVAF